MNPDKKNGRPAMNDALEDQGQKGRDAQAGGSSEETPIYLTGNSTLQTPEEHAHDASVDPRQHNSMEVNSDDLRGVQLGRMTGRHADGNDPDQV